MIINILLLLTATVFSLSLGAVKIDIFTLTDALLNFDNTNYNHQIILDVRLPRTITAALVGACFAASGAIMQGMTKNPIASPSLLGISSGSILALSIVFSYFTNVSYGNSILFSFLGAAISTVLIYFISSVANNSLTPVKMALAGASVNALFLSLSTAVSIKSNSARELAIRTGGSIAGVTFSQLHFVLPWLLLGILASLFISNKISVLSLGEEVAVGLGENTKYIRFAGSIIVLILAGASVSIAGNIGFIGLIAPHIARFLVGVKYIHIIPVTLTLGAILLLVSDILARVINPPFETPVGAITALIGVPFFLCLVRKEMRVHQ